MLRRVKVAIYELMKRFGAVIVKLWTQPVCRSRHEDAGEAGDYEYERAGTASVFLFTEPLAGWCEATAHERRTKVDLGHRDVAVVGESLRGLCECEHAVTSNNEGVFLHPVVEDISIRDRTEQGLLS